jgi:hypothetical protein
MAYWAQLDENNVVLQVLVMNDDDVASEKFLLDIFGGKWLKTSYNSLGGVHYGADMQPDGKPHLRYNYAGVGFSYDPEGDAFYATQPNLNAVLDKTTYLWVDSDTQPQ